MPSLFNVGERYGVEVKLEERNCGRKEIEKGGK